MKLYLVMYEGKPCAAYPRLVQSKVYASGFSRDCIIISGEFVEDAPQEIAEEPKTADNMPSAK